jgi:hypothetical protein
MQRATRFSAHWSNLFGRNWLEVIFCDDTLHGAESFRRIAVNVFSAFYGTRKFIIVFTTARHLSISWARLTYSTPCHPISTAILISSSHKRQRLPSSLPTNTLHTTAQPPLPLLRATSPAHFNLFDLARSTNRKDPHYVIFSTLLLPRLSLAQIHSPAPYFGTWKHSFVANCIIH